jgi:spore germination cell wall hydrolase CwlJ-like protein
VLVADGFTGNVALKVIEGTSDVLLRAIRDAAMSSWRSKLGGLLLKPALGGLRAAIDPEAQGTVPRSKPETASLFGWLRTRMAPAPQDHSWASKPLPLSVYEPAQQKCLAEGIYFEARGESVEGQAAVAQVILNRVKAPVYPDTICGVVYQNKSWRNRCQFSFACDRVPDRIRNQKAWGVAQRVAAEVTSGKAWNPEIGSSTHYHATYVKPRWAGRMKRMDRIGRHIFYKTYRGGLS